MVTKKMHKQENSSKYNTMESRIAPVFPNAARAISGNEWIGFLIRASGTDPGGSGVLYGESLKYEAGRGSPFSCRPIIIDVFQATNENDVTANEAPNQPAAANANGSPSSPTPWNQLIRGEFVWLCFEMIQVNQRHRKQPVVQNLAYH